MFISGMRSKYIIVVFYINSEQRMQRKNLSFYSPSER